MGEELPATGGFPHKGPVMERWFQVIMYLLVLSHSYSTWSQDSYMIYSKWKCTNKANLRDLIAATGLVILLKLDSNRQFFACVTLKFNGWPRKIVRHVFYTTSSFVYHFRSISEFKLELQSGNAQFGSKSIFFSRVTLQFDVWPRKTIEHLFYASSSFVHHYVAIGDFKLEIQSGNAQFGSNSTIFSAMWPCNLMYDLEKTIGHLFYATSSFVYHFVAIGELKLELQSGNVQFGSNLTIFRAVWP